MKASLIYIRNGNGRLATGLPVALRVATEADKKTVEMLGFGASVFVEERGARGYPDDGVFSEIEVEADAAELAEMFSKGTRMVADGKIVAAENQRVRAQLDGLVAAKALGI